MHSSTCFFINFSCFQVRWPKGNFLNRCSRERAIIILGNNKTIGQGNIRTYIGPHLSNTYLLATSFAALVAHRSIPALARNISRGWVWSMFTIIIIENTVRITAWFQSFHLQFWSQPAKGLHQILLNIKSSFNLKFYLGLI